MMMMVVMIVDVEGMLGRQLRVRRRSTLGTCCRAREPLRDLLRDLSGRGMHCEADACGASIAPRLGLRHAHVGHMHVTARRQRSHPLGVASAIDAAWKLGTESATDFAGGRAPASDNNRPPVVRGTVSGVGYGRLHRIGDIPGWAPFWWLA